MGLIHVLLRSAHLGHTSLACRTSQITHTHAHTTSHIADSWLQLQVVCLAQCRRSPDQRLRASVLCGDRCPACPNRLSSRCSKLQRLSPCQLLVAGVPSSERVNSCWIPTLLTVQYISIFHSCEKMGQSCSCLCSIPSRSCTTVQRHVARSRTRCAEC